ncbi:uncharacterized protein PV09_08849 [Verruconis gallopava]|uniref:AttH domain-containing protein n=1 Tax=Verruconis gallopava TaxID=253628 RepID=A0A0D1ZZV0_9PEZI|nr:uncharacterized protein PV09_08849 [Verruconis gallopava]KIV99549.1 hypothetical protein PV09_08849 [Verruconis gallopava]
MQFNQLWSLVGAASWLFSDIVCAKTYTIPNSANPGSQNIEYIAKATEFDGQKITPYPNSNSYEWWYFDAVSSTTQESVTIVFFETLGTTFPTSSDSYLSIQFAGTLEDGSYFIYAVPAKNTSVATVTTSGNGASGVWQDTGFSFEGSSTMTKYTVEVDNDEFGIYGTFVLNSVSPAHGPCGPACAGANEKLFNHVGWANAVPDANTVVNMTVNGSALQFNGYGYHDKNWGDTVFTDVVQSWYWGHGRLGPYSIVWFDALDTSGVEHTSGYITKGSTVIESSCASGSVVARPYGANADYPPQPSSGVPTGFDITFNTGTIGTVQVQATVETIQIPGVAGTTYGRYIGPLSGTVAGKNYTGTALFEQFKFASS